MDRPRPSCRRGGVCSIMDGCWALPRRRRRICRARWRRGWSFDHRYTLAIVLRRRMDRVGAHSISPIIAIRFGSWTERDAAVVAESSVMVQ